MRHTHLRQQKKTTFYAVIVIDRVDTVVSMQAGGSILIMCTGCPMLSVFNDACVATVHAQHSGRLFRHAGNLRNRVMTYSQILRTICPNVGEPRREGPHIFACLICQMYVSMTVAFICRIELNGVCLINYESCESYAHFLCVYSFAYSGFQFSEQICQYVAKVVEFLCSTNKHREITTVHIPLAQCKRLGSDVGNLPKHIHSFKKILTYGKKHMFERHVRSD